MKITREDIVKEYNENQLTQEQIASKLGCSRRWIGKLMTRYSLKVNPYRKVLSIPITKQQKSIIVASILGDGSVVKNGNLCRLQLAHGKEQQDYLLWKMSMLNPLAIQRVVTFHKDEGMVYTHNHPYFNILRNLFYGRKGKRITSIDALKDIDEQGLAIWFMDDGTRGPVEKKQLSIATQSFSDSSHKNLVSWLKSRFGLIAKVLNYKSEGKHYCRIYFGKDDSRKLANMISEYIHPSLRYKLEGIL